MGTAFENAAKEIEGTMETAKRYAEASRSPGCYPSDGNSVLRGFAAFYELDGDLIRCRLCKRACIASRASEKFIHSDGCKNGVHFQPNPWIHLREMLNEYVDG